MNLLRALGTRNRVGATPEIRLNQDIPFCGLGSRPQCTLKAKTELELPPRAAAAIPVYLTGELAKIY